MRTLEFSRMSALEAKKYTVFISSTFEDLKEERAAVSDTVVRLGDFPVQMESFPAADEDQMTFIKSLIDRCDYYVLIIAGRYGSLDDDGKSYTEKEYDYAVSQGVPVLALIHADPGSLTVSKSEDTEMGQKKLAAFKDKVQSSRLRASWTDKKDLQLGVREALEHAKATQDRIGWVRADKVASEDILQQLFAAREENQAFREKLKDLGADFRLPDLPPITSETKIKIQPREVQLGYGPATIGSAAEIVGRWIDFFPHFHKGYKYSVSDWNNEYSYHCEEDDSRREIGNLIVSLVASFDPKSAFTISSDSLQMLEDYFLEAGLMSAHGDEPFTAIADSLVRRIRLASHVNPSIKVVDGELKLTTVKNPTDEIPF